MANLFIPVGWICNAEGCFLKDSKSLMTLLMGFSMLTYVLGITALFLGLPYLRLLQRIVSVGVVALWSRLPGVSGADNSISAFWARWNVPRPIPVYIVTLDGPKGTGLSSKVE